MSNDRLVCQPFLYSFLFLIALGLHNLTLYIISDAYLGLDQQYDIYLDVQISTEMDLSKQKNSK